VTQNIVKNLGRMVWAPDRSRMHKSPATCLNATANATINTSLNASLLPPPALVYSTANLALCAVKDWARIYHYAIVEQRSKKRKGNGEQYKFYMRCDHGGKYLLRTAIEDYHQRKQISSQKTECPFSLTITELSGQWYIEIRNLDHNHAPSASDLALPDLHQESVIEMIWTHQKSGLTATQTLTTI
jgi:hypothetical protein